MRRTSSARRWQVAAAFIVAVGFLGACTPSNGNTAPSPTVTSTPSPSASPTPTPTVDPATAEAEAAVLEAYRGYWAAKVVSYADPTREQDPNLARFADDAALTEAQSAIFTLRSNGISIPGEPVLAPVVSAVELGGLPTAKITDCVDSTNWQPIYTASGESAAAPDQSMRVVTVSTAFVAEGRWLIRTSVPHRDQSC